jgi:hypothetical protein
MGDNKGWVIIAAALLGTVADFILRPIVFPSEKEAWRVIKADAGYSNVKYPAYLLNERTGKVVLIGSASYDKNNDGKDDDWSTYNEILYEGEVQ